MILGLSFLEFRASEFYPSDVPFTVHAMWRRFKLPYSPYEGSSSFHHRIPMKLNVAPSDDRFAYLPLNTVVKIPHQNRIRLRRSDTSPDYST